MKLGRPVLRYGLGGGPTREEFDQWARAGGLEAELWPGLAPDWRWAGTWIYSNGAFVGDLEHRGPDGWAGTTLAPDIMGDGSLYTRSGASCAMRASDRGGVSFSFSEVLWHGTEGWFTAMRALLEEEERVLGPWADAPGFVQAVREQAGVPPRREIAQTLVQRYAAMFGVQLNEPPDEIDWAVRCWMDRLCWDCAVSSERAVAYWVARNDLQELLPIRRAASRGVKNTWPALAAIYTSLPGPEADQYCIDSSIDGNWPGARQCWDYLMERGDDVRPLLLMMRAESTTEDLADHLDNLLESL